MTEAAGVSFKTLGVKLPDDVHARLTLVAQLDRMTLTDAILAAVDQYIDGKRSEAGFAERAAAALAEIEREATARREAVQTLFGGVSPTATPVTSEAAEETSKRRKA